MPCFQSDQAIDIPPSLCFNTLGTGRGGAMIMITMSVQQSADITPSPKGFDEARRMAHTDFRFLIDDASAGVSPLIRKSSFHRHLDLTPPSPPLP